jgi:hypothetical protein
VAATLINRVGTATSYAGEKMRSET